MTQSQEPKTVSDDAGEHTRVLAGGSRLDGYFHISRRGSTVAREVRGGVTTFMAMAYILLLNPLILSGKDAAGGTLGQQALHHRAPDAARAAGHREPLAGESEIHGFS